MRSRFFRVSLILFLATLFAACNQAAESTTPLSESDIVTELARSPYEDAATIVEGTKLGSAEEDEDIDHDLIADASDNCPTISNQNQTDENSDGIGDACANL